MRKEQKSNKLRFLDGSLTTLSRRQINARATTPYLRTSEPVPITCASSKSECCVGGGGWGVYGRCTASFREGFCSFAGVLCERLLLSLGLTSEGSSQSLSKTPWKKSPDINTHRQSIQTTLHTFLSEDQRHDVLYTHSCNSNIFLKGLGYNSSYCAFSIKILKSALQYNY